MAPLRRSWEQPLSGSCGAVAFGRRVALFLTLLAALTAFAPPAPPAHAQSFRETLAEYEVVNGYFFTQTGGGAAGELGFGITDEGGIPFWSEYQRLGGPDALGYPVSRRFEWGGFVSQATQKVVLQWRPEEGRAVFVNVLDELTRAGRDEWLLAYRQVPLPAQLPGEETLTFDQVIQARLRLLQESAPLRAAYLRSADPLAENGLPVAPITDVGPALVLRAQRRAFQLWKMDTPFARAGAVTIVNAGDLAKEADLLPDAAEQPEPAGAQVASPPGSNTRVSSDELARLRLVAERARPAVVKLTDGSNSSGTGIIIDAGGLVLTNSHVVTGLNRERLRAVLPDGRSFSGKTLGWDEWTDIAVVQLDVPAQPGATRIELPAVPLGSAQALGVDQRVLALGYSAVFPAPPSAKTGTVRSLSGQIQVDRGYPLFDLIQSDTFIYPGDSGGPLLDLDGRVVGVNSAIQVAFVPRQGRQLTGYSIPVEGALQIAQQLIATGSVPRPYLGITPVDLTPTLAASAGLPVTRGVLIVEVQPNSPAGAAGLVEGDIIAGMDGQPVTGLAALRRLIVRHQVGDQVPFDVLSAGQPRRTVALTLTDRPPLV